jgi:hypothetical protein
VPQLGALESRRAPLHKRCRRHRSCQRPVGPPRTGQCRPSIRRGDGQPRVRRDAVTNPRLPSGPRERQGGRSRCEESGASSSNRGVVTCGAAGPRRAVSGRAARSLSEPGVAVLERGPSICWVRSTRSYTVPDSGRVWPCSSPWRRAAGWPGAGGPKHLGHQRLTSSTSRGAANVHVTGDDTRRHPSSCCGPLPGLRRGAARLWPPLQARARRGRRSRRR